jgi:predicted amidophosphoribosyltransferase
MILFSPIPAYFVKLSTMIMIVRYSANSLHLSARFRQLTTGFKCPECGKPIPQADFAYCPYCAAPLKSWALQTKQ